MKLYTRIGLQNEHVLCELLSYRGYLGFDRGTEEGNVDENYLGPAVSSLFRYCWILSPKENWLSLLVSDFCTNSVR